jgi:LPXTG-site transpeptidase (sortase) family protein
VRKTLAVILLLVGVGLVYFGNQPGPDHRAFVRHQQEEVSRIEKGSSIGKCPPGAVIRYLGHSEPIAEGVSEKVLDSGAVGHFPGTGPVGVGNYSLTGHVVTHGEPFRYMPNLSHGDKVTVIKCGVIYTFMVDRRFTVYYTDISVLNAHPRTLTLVTCASRVFHTNYRTIVRGHLVDMHQVRQDATREVHRSA